MRVTYDVSCSLTHYFIITSFIGIHYYYSYKNKIEAKAEFSPIRSGVLKYNEKSGVGLLRYRL